MVRAPCCEKVGLKRGPWTPEEDRILTSYIQRHGHGNWRALPKQAGLLRCGKSCRLRWINYLRPDIKRGNFSLEEEETIIELHEMLGNRWSAIAARLPGRTDNEIKNVWHTHLKKRLVKNGVVQERKKRQPKEEPEEVVVEAMSNDSKEAATKSESAYEIANELCEDFWSEVFSSSSEDHQIPVPLIDFPLVESSDSDDHHGFSSNMYTTCENDVDIWHDILTKGGEYLSELLY